MNLKVVSSNIQEALEELEKIRDKINSKTINEVEFQVQLQHVYHHLNFAWNVRHQKSERYRNMTDEDFKVWGKYPTDLDFNEQNIRTKSYNKLFVWMRKQHHTEQQRRYMFVEKNA